MEVLREHEEVCDWRPRELPEEDWQSVRLGQTGFEQPPLKQAWGKALGKWTEAEVIKEESIKDGHPGD